jgi:hypothetical protein
VKSGTTQLQPECTAVREDLVCELMAGGCDLRRGLCFVSAA